MLNARREDVRRAGKAGNSTRRLMSARGESGEVDKIVRRSTRDQ